MSVPLLQGDIVTFDGGAAFATFVVAPVPLVVSPRKATENMSNIAVEYDIKNTIMKVPVTAYTTASFNATPGLGTIDFDSWPDYASNFRIPGGKVATNDNTTGKATFSPKTPAINTVPANDPVKSYPITFTIKPASKKVTID